MMKSDRQSDGLGWGYCGVSPLTCAFDSKGPRVDIKGDTVSKTRYCLHDRELNTCKESGTGRPTMLSKSHSVEPGPIAAKEERHREALHKGCFLRSENAEEDRNESLRLVRPNRSPPEPSDNYVLLEPPRTSTRHCGSFSGVRVSTCICTPPVLMILL